MLGSMKRLLALLFVLFLSLSALARAPIDQDALRANCDSWVFMLAHGVHQQKLAGLPREAQYAAAAKQFSGKDLEVAKAFVDAIYAEDAKKLKESMKALSQVCVDYTNRKAGA